MMSNRQIAKMAMRRSAFRWVNFPNGEGKIWLEITDRGDLDLNFEIKHLDPQWCRGILKGINSCYREGWIHWHMCGQSMVANGGADATIWVWGPSLPRLKKTYRAVVRRMKDARRLDAVTKSHRLRRMVRPGD